MYLVWVEHMALSRKAISASAAIVKRLNSRKGQSNRVGIVAVWGKSATADMDFDTLDPRASFAHADTFYTLSDPPG
jgi:hypothetical protein